MQNTDPFCWISLARALTTPTSVQLRSGPVKYETPLFRTSASIFLSARAEIACENKVAEISRSVLGFVDLNVD